MHEFGSQFKGMTIFVTGHTGFKGSWLTIWLRELGAHVVGYSLEPPTQPSHFSLTNLDQKITHIIGDVRDYAKLSAAIQESQPQLIFHLAAQPLVLRSFHEPRETMDINVGGSVNLLEAVRHTPSVRAVVMITSDKCYENQEWIWGYRESDLLGGHDPYSASKSMAELAISSYRRSFFTPTTDTSAPAVASVRAGNVIGGGDFSDFRLVPDCMKALLDGKSILVRNPDSVRPWLHVLEPLSGYLWLSHCLLKHGQSFAEAWNFGPAEQQGVTTLSLVKKAIEAWGSGEWNTPSVQPKSGVAYKEMGLLRLSCEKAAHRLHWQPSFRWDQAVEDTVRWFKAYQAHQTKPTSTNMYEVAVKHIQNYVQQAKKQKIKWALQSAEDKELCTSSKLL